MIDLVNFLKDKVESYSPKISIDNVVVVDNVYTVETCDTFYITPNRILIVNGSKAKVISFIKDVEFTFSLVIGEVIPPTIDEIILEPFKFFYGTTTSTSEEVDKLKDIRDKVPFVWLHSVYDEEYYRGKEKRNYDFDANVRMFALDQCDEKGWLQMNHHNNVIVPLKSFMIGLLDYIDKQTEIKDTNSVNIESHANFGRYVAKGNVEKIFEMNLSGVSI